MLKRNLCLLLTVMLVSIYCAAAGAADVTVVGETLGDPWFESLFDGDPDEPLGSGNYPPSLYAYATKNNLDAWNGILTAGANGAGQAAYDVDGDRTFLRFTLTSLLNSATTFAQRFEKFIPSQINSVSPVYVVEFDFLPATAGSVNMVFRGVSTSGGSTAKELEIWKCNGSGAPGNNFGDISGYGWLASTLSSLTESELENLLHNTSEWHHSVVIIDTYNKKASTFVNGFAIRHDVDLSAVYADASGNFSLRFYFNMTGDKTSCGIDNFSVRLAGERQLVYDSELYAGAYSTANRSAAFAADTNYVTKALVNESSSSYNATFITAVYDGNKLLDVYADAQLIPARYHYFFKKELDIDSGATDVKVFLWDGAGTMTPITEVDCFLKQTE